MLLHVSGPGTAWLLWPLTTSRETADPEHSTIIAGQIGTLGSLSHSARRAPSTSKPDTRVASVTSVTSVTSSPPHARHRYRRWRKKQGRGGRLVGLTRACRALVGPETPTPTAMLLSPPPEGRSNPPMQTKYAFASTPTTLNYAPPLSIPKKLRSVSIAPSPSNLLVRLLVHLLVRLLAVTARQTSKTRHRQPRWRKKQSVNGGR